MAPQFYQETGGNLYLLTELTQAYRRSGDIDAILQTMGEILTQRLSGLSENAGYVAQLIALFPEGVSSRLLLELMDGDDRQLTAGLEELRGRGIIEGRPTERDVAYSFIHQRIRELICSRSSAYQLQPPAPESGRASLRTGPPLRGRGVPPDRPAFSACRGPPAGPGVSDPRAGAGQLPRLHPLLPLRRRKAAVQKRKRAGGAGPAVSKGALCPAAGGNRSGRIDGAGAVGDAESGTDRPVSGEHGPGLRPGWGV